jgi:hypothetical protein
MAATISPLKNPVFVLAWVENDGFRPTGRHIQRDRNWVEETISCPRAHACVWSRDMDRQADGEALAASEGKTLLLLEDTDDVLSVARATVLPGA